MRLAVRLGQPAEGLIRSGLQVKASARHGLYQRATMQHERATLGIMITISSHGHANKEFANGKPLHLIDGPA